MRLHWITSAALSMSVAAAFPALASAGPAYFDGPGHAARYDRNDYREHEEHEYREHRDEVHVPRRVLDTAERVGNGRYIDSVTLVRGERRDVFLVRMVRADKEPITLRIEPDGDLISIDR